MTKGSPQRRTKHVQSEEYRMYVTEIRQNMERCKEFLQNESCIMLISNVVECTSSRDLLGIYNGQQVVENSFRLLKAPCMASVIYLKKEKRIKALSMLLTFSLLIRAINQYRLREGLKTYKAENPGVQLKVGLGNRPLKNPTFQLLQEHPCNCYFEKEKNGRI